MGMHDGNEVHYWEQAVTIDLPQGQGTATFTFHVVQEVCGGIVQEPEIYVGDDDRVERDIKTIIEHGFSVENCTGFEVSWNPRDGHEAKPVTYNINGNEHTECSLCKYPVHWTGTDAKDSPTGKTIPGPWVHSLPSNEEGPTGEGEPKGEQVT